MGRIVKKLQDGFIKFHGCGLYHRDGSNVLITKKDHVLSQFYIVFG